MTTQHTPGPWNHAADSLRPGRYSIYHNGPIAHCGDTTAEPGDGLANARLIAAAPDLLNACRQAADWIDRHRVSGALGVYDLARAAIAKAEGRNL